MDELSALRAVIDDVDHRLVALLAERARAVAELWSWKRQAQVPLIDATRETELGQRWSALADAHGLPRDTAAQVLSAVLRSSTT